MLITFLPSLSPLGAKATKQTHAFRKEFDAI